MKKEKGKDLTSITKKLFGDIFGYYKIKPK